MIALFLSVWAILLGRIYQISIKSNAYYETLANQNIVKKEWILPVRGEILDRNGKPLAINQIGFKILIAPHLSGRKKRESLRQAVDAIVRAFGEVDRQKIIRRYLKKDSPYHHDPIVVVNFLSYKKVLPHYTELSRTPNLSVEPTTKRYYPYGPVTAHVVGYVGKANEKEIRRDEITGLTGIAGKSGLERYYNRFLEGVPGYRKVMVSAFNKEVAELERVDPKEESDMTLYLDMRLQQYLSDLFAERNATGAVVVMGVNGEVLAAGSYPAYDPNDFVSGISRDEWRKIIEDLNHPFTNKLIHGLYPPGSVIKPGVALALVDSGKVSPYHTFFCNGAIELGKRIKHKFRCWKSVGHGKTDMVKAIRESCDVYFYKGSLQTGINKIAEDLRQMGFGHKTGIDLPNEFIGVMPDKMWKMNRYGQPWYIGETLNAAIGQGYVLVTPMQIARYTAMLATGRLPKPTLAKRLAKQMVPLMSEEVLTPRQKQVLPLVQRAMYEVCNHPKGTAYAALHRCKVKVAGKTGTAQVIGIPQEEKKRMKEEDLAYFHRSHAWLTTYGPYRNPQYVVTILVEHGGHGGHAAGPIAEKIYNWLLKEGYIR